MTTNNDIKIPVKPFIKWAGGKSALIASIAPHIPKLPTTKCYWEPFLGGGSLYFHLKPTISVLSDMNHQLINCYRDVRDNTETLHSYLMGHAILNTESYYYSIRELYNNSKPSIEQSARFIYLNRTCFNGLYRENRAGKFNVPFGRREKPPFPNLKELSFSSSLLKGANLLSGSFERIIDDVNDGDFVYLDPPYTVMHNNNGFIKYNSKLFSWDDQERLRETVDILTKRGSKVLISNAAHPSVKDLYDGYEVITINRASCISANGKHRTKIEEYLIRNY